MGNNVRFPEQLRRNAVALISLAVAIIGLSYNTWRNEQTEYNRNQRGAAFELLLKLAELDETVNLAHYEPGPDGHGNLKSGWALVNTIDVITAILKEPLPAGGDRLVAVWATQSPRLGGNDEVPVELIRAEIDTLQASTVAVIKSLE